MERLGEASTYAGLALAGHGIAGLLHDWKNSMAWADLFCGLAAILKREGKPA